MKQIVQNYTYNKTSGVISLTDVNIDRDQLLLVVNTTRNITYYNFADSATTLQAFTQGANTSVTLASSVISASSTHTNADALTIYYDDQISEGTVISIEEAFGEGSSMPISPAQGTTVTNTTFTSITPSTPLVSAVADRRVLSVFNEGPGLLYISGGGTCTTTSYQVRLGVGGYFECPAGQISLAHSAVFATTGTARVSQVT